MWPGGRHAVYLHDLAHASWIRSVTIQINAQRSYYRQVRILDDVPVDRDMSYL